MAFDANAVRVAIEQNDAEINDDELSLISAISNLLPKNGYVPLDIAKPICPLYIHKLRMIGATFDVKKDAARDRRWMRRETSDKRKTPNYLGFSGVRITR